MAQHVAPTSSPGDPQVGSQVGRAIQGGQEDHHGGL